VRSQGLLAGPLMLDTVVPYELYDWGKVLEILMDMTLNGTLRILRFARQSVVVL